MTTIEHEGPKALAAFMLYRDFGPTRSLEQLHQHYPDTTPSVRQLKTWSASFNWVERCRAHDEAIAAEAAERDKQARLADIDRKRQDRIKVAAAVRGKGVSALTHMKAEDLALRPDSVTRMLTYADAVERLDMGEATERIDFTQMSDEELDAKIAAYMAAQGKR